HLLAVDSKSLHSVFFFSSRRRHTRFSRDWSSDVCSSDLVQKLADIVEQLDAAPRHRGIHVGGFVLTEEPLRTVVPIEPASMEDRSEERRVGKEWRARGRPDH